MFESRLTSLCAVGSLHAEQICAYCACFVAYRTRRPPPCLHVTDASNVRLASMLATFSLWSMSVKVGSFVDALALAGCSGLRLGKYVPRQRRSSGAPSSVACLSFNIFAFFAW